MSEPVLKAIMRLFALVAKEDQVTQQERDHIQAFLADHLNQKAIASHLELFDDYSSGYSGKESAAFERETIGFALQPHDVGDLARRSVPRPPTSSSKASHPASWRGWASDTTSSLRSTPGCSTYRSPDTAEKPTPPIALATTVW